MNNDNSNLINHTGILLSKSSFGEIDGHNIDRYTIKFKSGLKASLLNYGGIIQSLHIPDKTNHLKNIVEGYNSLNDYLTDENYTGAIIGRYANRIKKGNFELNGENFELTKNHAQNHLHGGRIGFHNTVWNCKSIEESEDKISITFSHLSNDGAEGYPGNLEVNAQFIFTKDSFQIEYTAESDKDTILNMTHHSYFNLNGVGQDSIENHLIQINAFQYLVVDQEGIPISKMSLKDQIAFDFRKEKSIGFGLKQLKQESLLNHFDHCYILNAKQPAAIVFSPKTGIKMEIITNQAGMQLYTLHQPNKSNNYPSFCLEPQYFPDAPNSPDSEGAILRQGDIYKFKTIYQFSII